MWRWIAGIVLGATALGLWLTEPVYVLAEDLPPHAADPERGRRIFAIGGCASCHAAERSEGEARLRLLGGRRFATPFGTFVAPNITPHPEAGIGRWSEAEFVSAMLFGTAPDGAHYYPAFPYASYARMEMGDVRDLWAFLRTLPADPRPNDPHEVGFPFSIRRGIGVWKLLYLRDGPVVAGLAGEAEAGRYLVEGPGHCGECHTPRDALGGPDLSAWLAGAPNPDGPGRIPNITPGKLGWSAKDIAYYLESGFTPDYDSAGGGMAEVIRNTAALTPADRAAIAAYLKAVPAVD